MRQIRNFFSEPSSANGGLRAEEERAEEGEENHKPWAEYHSEKKRWMREASKKKEKRGKQGEQAQELTEYSPPTWNHPDCPVGMLQEGTSQ
jgi:hypothetical protein